MRVIAGIARGHPLRSIESPKVRPTADKVKGAIFSMLESIAYKRGLVEPGYLARVEEGELAFPWRTVLDLYAGSGALGIEALSRGAAMADFVEADPRAREAIVENLRRTGLASRARVHGMRAEAAISTFKHPYDLILMDPPYDDPAAETVFTLLCESALVGPSTYLVLEHSRQRTVPSRCGPLTLIKSRYHGRTGISIYAAGQQE
ncbi:MAG: RsmD family RNA methyltransferase [Sphingomonadaceae bacterium]